VGSIGNQVVKRFAATHCHGPGSSPSLVTDIVWVDSCKCWNKLVHRVVEKNKVLKFPKYPNKGLMSEMSALSSQPHGVPIYFYIYNCFLRNTAAHTSFH